MKYLIFRDFRNTDVIKELGNILIYYNLFMMDFFPATHWRLHTCSNSYIFFYGIKKAKIHVGANSKWINLSASENLLTYMYIWSMFWEMCCTNVGE